MSAVGPLPVGPLRHVAARSLTVAFGAKRTFGGRPPQRIYEFAASEATFEPNLNVAYFDLTVRRPFGRAGALPTRSGRLPVSSVPGVFARPTTRKKQL
jgi:hypothetical protein